MGPIRFGIRRFFFSASKKSIGLLQPRCPPAIGDVTEFLLGAVGNGELSSWDLGRNQPYNGRLGYWIFMLDTWEASG